MASGMYNKGKKALVDGTAPWNGTPVFRVMLVTSGYTFNPDHDFVSDLTPGTNELTGTGYLRKTLASLTVTESDAADRAIASSASVLWSAINAGTAAAIVVYLQVGGSDATPADDVLIYYGDISPDQATNGGDLTVTPDPTNGWFYL